MRRKFNLHPQRRNLCEFDMASKLIMFGIDCQSPIKNVTIFFRDKLRFFSMMSLCQTRENVTVISCKKQNKIPSIFW